MAPVQMNQTLLTVIRSLIFSARRQVSQAVNAGLTMLYWEIGRRIHKDIIEEKRAACGKEIVPAPWQQLNRTHFKSMIPIGDCFLRQSYDKTCDIELLPFFRYENTR
ncbi:MAG: DUF1016 N-terminal domain-containing protein [Thermodesulfobacteriota bacterium]|nr:DUF1016 N-terminal domain-containing protein [Thermodesulfobacteriota bacterium]